MSDNAKTKLFNLLAKRGWIDRKPALYNEKVGEMHHSTVVLDVPVGRFEGSGKSTRKTQAEVNACAHLLTKLQPHLERYSDDLMQDAQRGDYLVKLAAAICHPGSTSVVSRWLQDNESDDAWQRVFDRWTEMEVAGIDAHMGSRGAKHRSSVVEALIWRAFEQRLRDAGLHTLLQEVFELVGAHGARPPPHSHATPFATASTGESGTAAPPPPPTKQTPPT